MPTETDAEKIERLEKENADLRAALTELRRELEEWKRGHRIRDRRRRGRSAKLRVPRVRSGSRGVPTDTSE